MIALTKAWRLSVVSAMLTLLVSMLWMVGCDSQSDQADENRPDPRLNQPVEPEQGQ